MFNNECWGLERRDQMRIINKIAVCLVCINLNTNVNGVKVSHNNFANNKSQIHNANKRKPELIVVKIYKAITHIVKPHK